MRREADTAWAREAVVLGETHEFLIPLFVAKIALASASDREPGGDAIATGLQQELGRVSASETQLGAPQILGTIADVCLEQGQVEAAEGYIRAALGLAEATGQPFWDAELHRLEAKALLQPKDDSEAAQALLRRVLDIARSQQARSLELRGATGLARILHASERDREARALLAPTLGWFTEGFDTQDLKDAKALLDELA